MSDSPKYTSAQLSREREARLARDRAEREAERRRRAEEKQRQEFAARVERQQTRARQLAAQCAALRPRAERAGRATGVAEAATALAVAERTAGAARSDVELRVAQEGLDGAQARLVDLEREVIAAIAREERAALLRALRDQAAEVNATLAARFDPDGARAAADGLLALERELAVGQFDDFDRRREGVARAVASHVAAVAAAQSRWLAEREEARALVEELAAGYRGLAPDARQAGMPAPEVARMEMHPGELARRLEREEFAAIVTGAGALRAELAAITSRVEAWLERRARRETIMTVIAEALPELGFSVDPRSLDARVEGEELTVLRAYRASGGELQVQVGHDPAGREEVYYDTEGFPHREQVVNGSVVRTCDELEGLLTGLHEVVRGQGVELGELEWEGKPATHPDSFNAVRRGGGAGQAPGARTAGGG